MELPGRDLEAIDTALSDSFEAFRGARIVLTGGSGFVGRWLIESFAFANSSRGLGARLWTMSRDPSVFRSRAPHVSLNPAITIVNGSLESLTAEGTEAFPSRCDYVIHAATASSSELATSGPGKTLSTIEGSRQILEYAVRSGARRFLYVSSGAVYRRQPDSLLRVPEEFTRTIDPHNPISAYAETKLRSEILCTQYSDRFGLTTVIARGFSFLGPLLPLGDKFAAGSFLEDVLHGATVRVHGDGAPLRSYLYAGDMSAWLWTILLRGLPGRAYNVGSEHPVSIAELARSVASLVDPPLPVEMEGTPNHSATPGRYVPSTERARSELGLVETVDWRESLRRTYEWLLKKPIPAEKLWASR